MPLSTETMQQEAERYAKIGCAIFPCYGIKDGSCACGNSHCSSPGKHPMTKGGFRGATSDLKQVAQWWAQWPDANIGWALPPNVVVVDVDVGAGKAGLETLAQLEQKYDPLPSTVTSLTGGGGRHYFFQTDIPLHCTTGVFPSIDIRTSGGYVILPPSNHVSGRAYEWKTAPGSMAFAPLPLWIANALSKATQAVTTAATAVADAIPEGQRNEALFKLAAGLRAKGCPNRAYLRRSEKKTSSGVARLYRISKLKSSCIAWVSTRKGRFSHLRRADRTDKMDRTLPCPPTRRNAFTVLRLSV